MGNITRGSECPLTDEMLACARSSPSIRTFGTSLGQQTGKQMLVLLKAFSVQLRHLFGVSMVSIGRHPNWGTQLPLGQTGPSIASEKWYVGETLAGLQLQRGSIHDGHIGVEQTHIPPGPYGPALRNG